MELQLQQRLHRTKSGKPILQYIDGHVMRDYQVTHKVITTNNCRSRDEGNDLKCSASKTPASRWDASLVSLPFHRLDIDSRVDA